MQYTIVEMLYPEETYCKVNMTNRSGDAHVCFISKGKTELTVGQVLKGRVKKRGSPQFQGGFHNRPRALFKKELEVVGLSHAKREALFTAFKSQKLFELLLADKVAPIRNVEGIGIKTLESIRAAFETFKPVLDDMSSFGRDYPKLYRYVTENPKIHAAIIARYKSFHSFSQAMRDPFAIVLNDRFLHFPGRTTEKSEVFERSVKLRSRKRMAEYAAMDRSIAPNDPSYVRYHLICALYKKIMSSGDTWVRRSTLPKVIPDLPIVERDGMVTLAFFDDLERCFAQEMSKTIARHKKATDLSESQQKAMMPLDDVQRGAVHMTRDNAISILLGGAGTGKTTTSAAIVLGGSCTLAAPTGKAANRLKEVTGKPAFTVHKHYYSKAELSDKVLCDEMSMQGIVILTRLLMKGHFSKIVFVGDPGQLQSINPGQALKDLLLAGVRSTTLTKIYRTGPNSTIALNGERIYKGDADLHESESFELRKFTDYEDLVGEAVQIFRDTGTVPRILVKTNEEAAEINNLLRDKVNPAAVGRSETAKLFFRWQTVSNGSKRHLYAGYAYREGDLVMCTDNMYEETDNGGSELVAANGQVGVITKAKASSVQVRFGQLVLFKNKTDIKEKLVPAYAGTVHKAQGSEFDYVIVKASFQHWMQNHREWLYTAITRAQKKCIVFETETGDCGHCIEQVPRERKTFLADRIRHLFTSKRKREGENAFRALCKED